MKRINDQLLALIATVQTTPRRRDGQTMLEYAVLGVVIIALLWGAYSLLGGSVRDFLSGLTDRFSDAS